MFYYGFLLCILCILDSFWMSCDFLCAWHWLWSFYIFATQIGSFSMRLTLFMGLLHFSLPDFLDVEVWSSSCGVETMAVVMVHCWGPHLMMEIMDSYPCIDWILLRGGRNPCHINVAWPICTQEGAVFSMTFDPYFVYDDSYVSLCADRRSLPPCISLGAGYFCRFRIFFCIDFFFVTSVEWFFTVPTPAYGIDGQEVMWGHTTVGGQEHDSMWKLSYKLKYLAADERLYTGKEHQRSRHFAQEAWKRHSKLGKSKQKSWQIPVWLLYFKTLGFMTQKHLLQVAPYRITCFSKIYFKTWESMIQKQLHHFCITCRLDFSKLHHFYITLHLDFSMFHHFYITIFLCYINQLLIQHNSLQHAQPLEWIFTLFRC